MSVHGDRSTSTVLHLAALIPAIPFNSETIDLQQQLSGILFDRSIVSAADSLPIEQRSSFLFRCGRNVVGEGGFLAQHHVRGRGLDQIAQHPDGIRIVRVLSGEDAAAQASPIADVDVHKGRITDGMGDEKFHRPLLLPILSSSQSEQRPRGQVVSTDVDFVHVAALG